MIDGVTNVRPPAVLPNLLGPRGVSGRLAVPVNPVNSVYAHFDHVVGVPTSGGSAVSVMKMKMLDSLMERLGIGKPDAGSATFARFQRAAADFALATADGKRLGLTGKETDHDPAL